MPVRLDIKPRSPDELEKAVSGQWRPERLRMARSKGLIVVLGNRNSADGELAPVAKARADHAVQLSKQLPSYSVLGTGGFGAFNRSSVPHGRLLTDYLRSAGVSAGRLLPPINSAGTVDDALMTRRVAVDLGISKIVVVTSAAHIPRARFLFERALPEFELQFEAAVNADDSTLVTEEPFRLARDEATWIDPPLYGMVPPTGRDFPSDIYKNASDEQKAYDRISYLVVAGQFVLFGFAYTNQIWRGAALLAPVHLVVAVLIVSLFLMYLRTAGFANMGRDLMRLIELQWVSGYSLNIRRQNFAKPLPKWEERIAMPRLVRMALSVVSDAVRLIMSIGFTTTVAFVTFVMLAVQLWAFAMAITGRFDTLPTPAPSGAASPVPAVSEGAPQPRGVQPAQTSTIAPTVGAKSTATIGTDGKKRSVEQEGRTP